MFTEIIGYDDIRLHIYQYVLDANRGIVLATGEHMMLHVDTHQRRRAPINDYMGNCLAEALVKWSPIAAPKGLGAALRPVCE